MKKKSVQRWKIDGNLAWFHPCNIPEMISLKNGKEMIGWEGSCWRYRKATGNILVVIEVS